MFKRALVVGALLFSAAPAQAQKRFEPPKGLSDSAQVLYKQLVELMPRVRDAEKAFRRSDAEKRRESEEPLDTLRLGPYVVIAPDKESEAGFGAFKSAFEARKERLDGVSAPSTVVMIEFERPVPIFRFMARGPHTYVASRITDRKKEQRRELLRVIDESLMEFVPDSVRGWLSDGLRRVQPRSLSFREVAVGNSRVTQQCTAGNKKSCLDALGLGDTTRTNWYTPTQVRSLAMRSYGYRYHEKDRAACARTGDMNACLATVSMWGGLPAPVSSSVRGDFFQYVVERGGRGAIARLRAGGAPPAALSAAGNAPIETLMNDWLDDLRNDAGSVRRTNASVGLTTMFWSAVLLLFAMRSTRRRTR